MHAQALSQETLPVSSEHLHSRAKISENCHKGAGKQAW